MLVHLRARAVRSRVSLCVSARARSLPYLIVLPYACQEGERQSSRYAPSRELQDRAVGARYLCVVTIFVAFELEQPVINMSMLGCGNCRLDVEESSDQV